uniref:Uncharacterized protein n=1 Tax=Arundo donax TaxID=35708 RepID=A0A0A8YY52_ARUDO
MAGARVLLFWGAKMVVKFFFCQQKTVKQLFSTCIFLFCLTSNMMW